MRRSLTLILGVALFGILAAVVVASQGADDPVGTTDTVTETVERTTTVEDSPNRVRDDDNQAGDISGPRDEAEHAGDPRCAGQAPATGGNAPAPATGGVDISGPCDEAEHAGDPRCTGAPTGGRVDNSGPGSVNSGHDDDRGHPEYYPRFGFEPADALGLEAPFELPPEAWMAYRLPAYTPAARGPVIYPQAFADVP